MTTPVSSQWSLLHMDLITEILLRLPVKSLLRFKSACKTWQTIITSSYFVHQHLGQESNRTQLTVFWSITQEIRNWKTYGIYDVDTSKLVDPVSSFPGLSKDFHTGVVTAVSCPCNGIICVCINNEKYALWNPATRKSWHIPESLVKLDLGLLLSFWIDPLTSEFKIFWMTKRFGKDHVFSTYTSYNDSWRVYRQEEIPFHKDDIVLRSQCLVSHGFYYFLKVNWKSILDTAAYLNSFNDPATIIVYDIRNDLFQEVQKPNIENKAKVQSLYLYKDSLAMLVSERVSYLNRELRCIDIWVMNEKGCWSKLFNLDFLPANSKLLGFWKGNEILVSCRTNGPELMIYDAVSGEGRKLKIEKSEDATHPSFSPHCYKESLISLNFLS